MEMVIKTNQASPGMVVASDVVDRNGRVLLLSGNQLSEKHLKIFKAWGILEITIQSSQDKEVPSSGSTLESSEGDDIVRQVKELFRFADPNHPAIRELINVVLARKKESPS